jgi:hypothetical protein
MYGLMYVGVTAAFYLYIKAKSGYSGDIYDFVQGVFVYALFFPVIIMHSWDFISADSPHFIERLHSNNYVFLMVMIGYAILLSITSLFFTEEEMPLALLIPVIASSLIPTILHVYRNRHEQNFFA